MNINGSKNSTSNNRGIAAGGCVRNTQVDVKPKTTQENKPAEPSKTEDKPKDGTEVSDEAKDDKKGDKCEKCEDLKGLLEAGI